MSDIPTVISLGLPPDSKPGDVLTTEPHGMTWVRIDTPISLAETKTRIIQLEDRVTRLEDVIRSLTQERDEP